MQLCDEVITVYNNYTDPTTKYKCYLPTVITGVSWFGTVQVSPSNDGLVSSNVYTVRIPVNAITNKTYLSPKEFDKLQSSQKANYWTLSQGDSIVHGKVTDTGDNAKPAKLEAKYDEVITIVSVTDNRSKPNAKHWKVVGK